MTAVETAIRIVVDLLVRQQYGMVEAVASGKLTARDLEAAIQQYGRELAPPGEGWWASVVLTRVAGSAGALHAAVPLWTVEEGRSDLTLELELSESVPGVYDVRTLDLGTL